MFENIRQDHARRSHLSGRDCAPTIPRILFEAVRDAGFRAVFFYRIGRWCRARNLRFAAAFAERLMRHLCHCWVSTLADIGPGFIIAHVCGIVIPPGVVFGKDCDIRQNVGIGGNFGKRGEDGRENPWIGDHVSIGVGAIILGPIRIGSNSIIGANAVVTQSLPENTVVGAFRAEVLGQQAPDSHYPHSKILRPDKHVFLSRRQLYERIDALERKVEALEGRAAAD